MFWQDDSCPKARAVGAAVALADAIESVTWCHHPRVRGWPLEVFAEVLEDCGMFGRHCREVIEGFVNSRRETCGRDVVAEYALIRHMREKARLRNQLMKKVRDILLPFGSECLLISRASAEGDHDNFALLCGCFSVQEWACTGERTAKGQSCGS